MKTEAEELKELDDWIKIHLFGYRWWFDVLALECMLCRPDEVWQERKGFKLYQDGKEKPFGAKDFSSRAFSPTSKPADAMRVLEKCAYRLRDEDNDETVSVGFDDPYFTVEKTNCIPNLMTKAPTLPLAIVRFAKALFSK